MRLLAEAPPEMLRQVRGVFFDLDDTLTTDGRLTAAAYQALERLSLAGLLAVPVTGRPAGWCDHIARMWPVDAVIGENGAFYFRYDRTHRRMQREYAIASAARAEQRARLMSIAEEIMHRVPGAALAADHGYRETDLAIDFCEDVPRLPDSSIRKIVSIMERHGLTAKVSSIHVNGWFGTHDKLATTASFMQRALGIDLDAQRACYVFIGDSPNDAPMFAYFPNAIGVANVSAFAARIEHLPTYVTQASSGAGFCEAVACILAAQHGDSA